MPARHSSFSKPHQSHDSLASRQHTETRTEAPYCSSSTSPAFLRGPFRPTILRNSRRRPIWPSGDGCTITTVTTKPERAHMQFNELISTQPHYKLRIADVTICIRMESIKHLVVNQDASVDLYSPSRRTIIAKRATSTASQPTYKLSTSCPEAHHSHNVQQQHPHLKSNWIEKLFLSAQPSTDK